MALPEWDGLRLKCSTGSRNGWIVEKRLADTPEKERVAGIASPATQPEVVLRNLVDGGRLIGMRPQASHNV